MMSSFVERLPLTNPLTGLSHTQRGIPSFQQWTPTLCYPGDRKGHLSGLRIEEPKHVAEANANIAMSVTTGTGTRGKYLSR